MCGQLELKHAPVKLLGQLEVRDVVEHARNGPTGCPSFSSTVRRFSSGLIRPIVR